MLYLSSRLEDKNMPTIRIDEEVYEGLTKLAVPFKDTPNDVIRRLLAERNSKGSVAAVSEKLNRKPTRSRRGRATQKASYRTPILQALAESGGHADADAVLVRVEEAMRATLNAFDYGTVSSGEPRWRNWARFERADMVRDRLLTRDSPYGVWEMTDRGRKYLEQVHLSGNEESSRKVVATARTVQPEPANAQEATTVPNGQSRQSKRSRKQDRYSDEIIEI
jgi:predicted CopG family antitoxin